MEQALQTYGPIPTRVESELKELAIQHGVEQVILYGSRARGDYSRTSDIDLAIRGGNTKRFILDANEETYTLLQFDIVDLDSPIRPDLRASIEKEGRLLYGKA